MIIKLNVRRRIGAISLLGVFLLDIFHPTAMWALTGGPSQPEMESFEPVSTNQMVDLFTGDFTYNIPLMTVPGPGGGYPINIAYHAGIGMEQEASWVGLGWNINAGAITRNMRGLPDDFAGDEIKKETALKKNITFGLSTVLYKTSPVPGEIFGVETTQNLTGQLYFNNYRGVGLNIGYALNNLAGKAADESCYGKDAGWGYGINLNFDSQSGLDFHGSVSYGAAKDGIINSVGGGIGFNSFSGLSTIGLEYKRRNHEKNNAGYAPGVSFGAVAPMPGQFQEFSSQFYKLSFERGSSKGVGSFDVYGLKKLGTLGGTYTVNGLLNNTHSYSAYGYNNSELVSGGSSVMDHYYDKDTPVSKRCPNIPMPVATNDIYSITGQGTGGVFKPIRTEHGIYHEEGISSETSNYNLNMQFGRDNSSQDLHFGFDAGIGGGISSTGKFTDDAGGAVRGFRFSAGTNGNPLNERFYYKSSSEITGDISDPYGGSGNTDAICYKVSKTTQGEGIFRPVFVGEPKNQDGGSTAVSLKRSDREIRGQLITQRKRREIANNTTDIENGQFKEMFIISNPSTLAKEAYDYSSNYNQGQIDHHTAELTVTNADGSSYIYGLPAYNVRQREVMFNTAKQTSVSRYTNNPISSTYESTEASVDNNVGTDHFFHSTEMPAYTHTFLLTKVLSPDYVDLSGNGPSEDDFGAYTQFNYVKSTDNYKWRAPFQDCAYSKGFYSKKSDDKGSYTYGEKELYYLKTIETKTHIAIFYLGARRDGRGADSESNSENQMDEAAQNAQQLLYKIELFSKADMNNPEPIPLQTIEFEYDYSLCKGIPNYSDQNNSAEPWLTSDAINSNATSIGGKLTLKKIYISFNGSNKGALSPYSFDYNSGEIDGPTNYDQSRIDRWGNYTAPSTGYSSTWSYNSGNGYQLKENPYTTQYDYDIDDIKRAKYAGIWSIQSITMPSGAKLSIEYESDDYQYVQDAKAQQMYRIVGTNKSIFTNPESHLLNAETPEGDSDLICADISDQEYTIFFEIPEGIDSDHFSNYIAKDLDYLYFKTWQRLKKEPGNVLDLENNGVTSPDWAYDYVEGYAQIKKGSAEITPEININGNVKKYGRIELEPMEYGVLNNKVHPMRMAGWQYLRYERPDLFHEDFIDEETPNPVAIANIIRNVLSGAGNILFNYYNTAAISGYNKYIALDGEIARPSFIRLNNVTGRKYGGGHRVRSIKMEDISNNGNSYTTKYSYVKTDGSSSGVAEYEPMIGGEENALHKPIFFNGSSALLSAKNEDAYLEEPFGEAYYPAPGIGYSRVQVTQEVSDVNVTETGAPITVYDYYTAQDFPIRVTQTPLQRKGGAFNMNIAIPIVGKFTVQNSGYSQGYAVNLNNMHGQIKSVATYPQGTDFLMNPDALASSKTEYFYQTEPGNNKRLTNSVIFVTNEDGSTDHGSLGIDYEFFMSEREFLSTNEGSEIQANLEYDSNFFWPTAYPPISYSESCYRALATTKVIYQKGILSSVRHWVNGASTTTKNLMYDPETGAPVLTVVENEFDEPVYSFSYPAHWAYEGMAGGYKNIGARLTDVSTDAAGHIINTSYDPSDFLFPGDKLDLIEDDQSIVNVWVVEVNGSNVTLTYSDGTLASNLDIVDLKITRSGHRNMQGLGMGGLTTLTNPITPEVCDCQQNFVDALNQGLDQVESSPVSEIANISEEFLNCQGEISELTFGYTAGSTPVLTITLDGVPYNIPFESDDFIHCQGYPGNILNGTNSDCIENISAVFSTGSALTSDDEFLTLNFSLGANNLTLTIPFSTQGLVNCPLSVLNASAVEYSDGGSTGWNYAWADEGYPLGEDNIEVSDQENLYRYGRKGIWRAIRSFVYQVDRKQGELTDISRDGEYEHFYTFNWTEDNILENNPNWTWTSEITQFHPDGFAVEQRDPLGIYGAEILGYNSNIVTASCSNSRYEEFAYESFEENVPLIGSHRINGHWRCVNPNALSAAQSHTGRQSMELDATSTIHFTNTLSNYGTNLIPGKKYLLSTWVYLGNENTGAEVSVISTSNYGETNSTIASMSTTEMPGNIIDGWKKIDLVFEAPALSAIPGGVESYSIRVSNTSSRQMYLDDIRLVPFNSASNAYVYDVRNYRLLATLDDNNFATFYDYDEQGGLVQVKKETERGIFTISTSRQNTKQIQ